MSKHLFLKTLLLFFFLTTWAIPVLSQVDTAWVRRYNGPGNDEDCALGLVVDASGNVYVTGRSYGSGTDFDYATIKYYSNGDTAWVRRFNGPGNGSDEAADIAVDVLGNVYVTGTSGTIKYDAEGTQEWVGSWGGAKMVLDDSGNIYATGRGGLKCVTVKYLPNGDTAWVRTYTGPGHYEDGAYDIAIDGLGSVYITGYSFLGGWTDYVTIKYNSIGDTVWTKRYDGPEHNGDDAYAIALDGFGNVYVTGSSVGTGTWLDYATIKYLQFRRGDTDGNGSVTISDVIFLVNYLFKGGPAPAPIQAGNANCDGQVTVSDVIFLINYLFKDGPPPLC